MSSLPDFSRLVCVSDDKFRRYSEADIIELTDGRLLLVVTRKEGGSDFAHGTLVGKFSIDGGLSWDDDAHVIAAPDEQITDLMSVSLLRSPRGVHLMFMGRGQDPKHDTAMFQMLSKDEGKTWDKPQRISPRDGYHVVNNARVLRTKTGRIIAPAAFVPTTIDKGYEQQRIYCFFSDDDGVSWHESSDLVLEGKALMEPGVAQCADGSLYMIIRTKLKRNWEARSYDNGATWVEFKESPLPSPAAPSTVMRDPNSDDLWMIWCNLPEADWKGRSRQVFSKSRDHGKTWSEPRVIEEDPKGSFGYFSVDWVKNQVLLTYYDWRDRGQKNFEQTSLRVRMIPRAWFDGKVVPPVFQTTREPVLKQDQTWEGKTCSLNSGLLVERDRWRLWYTTGTLDPKGETLKVCYAESRDHGVTWKKDQSSILPASADDHASYYHPVIHRDGEQIVMHVWRRAAKDDSALHRYVSSDGRDFKLDPTGPLIVSRGTNKQLAQQAGDGRVSNDAFDVFCHGDGSWIYYAAVLEKATDKGAIFKDDNIPGFVRVLGRASSADGTSFSPIDIVLRPEYETRKEFAEQFYGIQVFQHRGFWLGLLHVFHVDSQIIAPEWAWSHDGVSWARTRIPCISLGDEGSFDSRMIVFGSVRIVGEEIVWLYTGCDWRHNAFKKAEIRSCIGRAALPLKELDAWLATLPQP